MLRRGLCVVLALLLCLAVSASDALLPRGSAGASGAVVFTHIQIGGAGATVGVASVPSANILLSRTDQYGCYISTSNSQWMQLATVTRLPTNAVTVAADGAPIAQGCDVIQGDKLTPTNLWLGILGNIYFSSNSGASFSTTCYPAQPVADMPPQNPGIKGLDPRLAVDPANSSIVYMSTPSSGLQKTTNQGGTCLVVSSVGTATGKGGHLIGFDTSGGTLTGASCPNSVSPCTKNIYVSTYGTGVYKSTDAGASWTLTTSTPTTHRYMAVGPDGVVWLVDDVTTPGQQGAAQRYNGTWSSPSFTNSTVLQSVAVDPNNCSSAITCHVTFLVTGGTSGTAHTINGGSNWNVTTSSTVVTPDVPWLAAQVNPSGFGFYPSGLAYDNSGHVYMGGEGAFWTTPVPVGSGTAITFTSQTAGIEESEVINVSTSPNTGGSVVIGGWDVGCFTVNSPFNTFPGNAQHGCANSNASTLQQAYAIDYAATAPSTFVSLVDSQGGYGGGTYINYSGKSTDGGQTWTTFSAPAPVAPGGFKGGCMAAASATNFIWMPTDNAGGRVAPYYTTDGGATWNNIILASQTDVLTTNASTSVGSNVLHFASVPAWVTAGVSSAYDRTTASALVGTVNVTATTSTTVTLSSTVTATVNSGDSILFSNGGWASIYYLQSHVCAADRVAANTFYIYNPNTGDGNGDAVIRCSSSGASCAVISRPGLGPNQQFNPNIKAVPGQQGYVFLAYGTTQPPGDTAGNGFYYYTGADSGSGLTKTAIAGFQGVTAFGFGKAAAGHTFPVIVAAGWYNHVYGIWESKDWDGAKTWQKLTDYPLGVPMAILDIDGDKTKERVFYYGTGSGAFCSAPNTADCNGGT